VDDGGGVEEEHAGRNVDEEGQFQRGGERKGVVVERGVEGAAFHELHDDAGGVGADAEELHDVGVPQTCEVSTPRM
jgi:hypothetical protein